METAAVDLIVTLLGITSIIAIALWEKIVEWVVESLFVWLKENLPKLAKFSDDVLKLAFTAINKASEELLQAVRKSWEMIRPFLFELRINFQEEASSWVRIIRSKIVKLDDVGKQPIIITQEVTEEIGFEDLPADVRAAIIRGSEKGREINIKELRDRELLEMVN
jgi:hypothetical protein